MSLLFLEHFDDVVDVTLADLTGKFCDLKVFDFIKGDSGIDFKRRNVFHVLPTLDTLGLDAWLSRGSQIFTNHRLLERLINDVTENFLTDTRTKPLLHHAHGNLAGTEARQADIFGRFC